MRIKLNLTKEHIALINNLNFEFNEDDKTFKLNQAAPYGGMYLYPEIALILGYFTQYIPETLYDIDGRKYPEELTNKFNELHEYIMDNLGYILDLKLYYNGEFKEGLYIRDSKDRTSWKIK